MDIVQGNTYRERCNYQVQEWAKGNSIHNTVDDECCPDFSCCNPKLLASEEHRKTFQAANQEQRETLLFSFLGGMISDACPDTKIMIVDGKNEIDQQLN